MHSTKFKFKTNQTLTMETILIISKKEMFSDSSRNYIRNKVRKFKNPFFDISFNLIYNIYMSLVQVTPDVTLSNVTLPITCY